jgi:NAD(P)-dependent dehydrogenase (short-subunit alcohol dehydrogenase family)
MTKSIFISGGGSGIGRAIALKFANEGWRVGLGDISASGMADTLVLLPGESHSAHRLDVRERAQWDEALTAFATDGRIDVMCNNAGIAIGGALMAISDGEIERLIAVNLTGVIHGARAAYPWLKAAAPGSCLVNTASAAALYGTAGMAVYSATKFGVRALTEALDTEWLDDGIAVRSLMPSFIDTPLLASPANASTNRTSRESVIAAGLPFTPVEEAAQAAWDAVHGSKLHRTVGKTAAKMAFAAKWMPGKLRQRGRKLMGTREG